MKAFDAQQAQRASYRPTIRPGCSTCIARRGQLRRRRCRQLRQRFVYGWTHDRAEAITVRADKEPLRIATAGTFDLAAPPAGLDVRLHVYERAMSRFPFCTDIGIADLVEEVWRPTRGTITIQLSPAEPSRQAPGHYRATIQISGAQFVSPSGVRVDQTQPITLSAIVGWLAG